MKVEMKEFEKWCGEYCHRFINKWDYYCLVSDAWLNGFYKGREACIDRDELTELSQVGEDKVEIEIQSNQLHGQHILTKEQFKNDMKIHYECDDLRVHDDGNGFISFQGTFKIKSKGPIQNEIS